MKALALWLPLALTLSCSADPGGGSDTVMQFAGATSSSPTSGSSVGGAPGQLPGAAGSTGSGSETTAPGNVPFANAGAGGAAAVVNPPAMGGAGGSTPAPVATNEFYVSTTGSDVNPGTIDLPFASLARAATVAQPGAMIWILPGTFNLAASSVLGSRGNAENRIRAFAAPGARPVFDFAQQPRGDSASRGIVLSGDFWHLKGLEVRNAGDNGVLVSGSNNIVEDLILHNNQDTGLQILNSEAQATDDTRAANNLILNCDSFANFDPANNGENADGFAAKLRIGSGNIFRGCRAWNNADDGWDFFAADDVVRIEDSWAFLNGFIAGGGTSAGDGNGFKLGGEPNGTGQGHAPHVVVRGSGFGNRTCGFTINNNEEDPVLSECGVGDNNDDYCGVTCSGEFDVDVSGAQAINLPRNADGSLPSLR
jgi:hypothetical protein